MPRNLSSGLVTSLSAQQMVVTDLIEIHLGTAVYFNNGSIDLDYDSPTAPDAGSNTYLAQGQFLSYGNIIESADLRINSIDMEFTAVDLTTIGLLLNNNFIDKRVVIYRVILGNDYTFEADDVWMLFDGNITAYGIKETGETATVTITVASQFADFMRTSGRKSNPASQNIHFANDRGMDFSPQIVKDIKWGKA